MCHIATLMYGLSLGLEMRRLGFGVEASAIGLGLETCGHGLRKKNLVYITGNC